MGVQPASEGDNEGKVKVIILDNCHYPKPPTQLKYHLNSGTRVKELLQLVANDTKYIEGTYILQLGNTSLKEDHQVQKGIYNLQKTEKWVGEPKNTLNPSVQMESNGDHPVQGPQPPLLLEYPSTSFSSTSLSTKFGFGKGVSDAISGVSYKEPEAKQSSGYVGLSNQGATCYMNSLIQTLYMTPEFRAALYRWSFDTYFDRWKAKNEEKATGTIEEIRSTREKKSIPRQLQLLFSRLQLSQQRAAKTKDLTASFGWKDSDAFTQHDVQELCRVLFDALEQVLKGTEQENLINELYQGTMKDYVRCLECGNESSRVDKYLDIPLVIRGFGETKAVASIEEALDKFVTTEDLKGDNQYSCEKCNKKTDAEKGLKFTEFPPLLTLQLKRFDFDYNTFRRIKLNDRVTFPHILDLNRFLKDEPQAEDQDLKDVNREEGAMDDGDDDATQEMNSNKNGLSDGDTEAPVREGDNGTVQAEKERRETSEERRDRARELIEENGKYVYELYSVLIHRGSALGGHYYAYIKSFSSEKWYEFNDSNVSEIEEEEVDRTFGDTEKKTGMFSSLYSSGANAYMLMYRRFDPHHKHEQAEVPAELKDRVESERKRVQEKEEEAEREKTMTTVRVMKEGADEVNIKVSRNDTIRQLTDLCASQFSDTKDMDSSLYRLRNMNIDSTIVKGPLDDEDTLTKRVSDMHWYGTKVLFLEVRAEDTEFTDYNPDNMTLRLSIYNEETQEFRMTSVSAPKSIKKSELQELIFRETEIPPEEQRILRESKHYSHHYVDILNTDTSVEDGQRLYVESMKGHESVESSPSMAAIDAIRNKTEVKVFLFGATEAQILSASKKDTVGKLRQMISEKYKEPVDSFKMMRYGYAMASEMRSDSESIPSSVYVEKGRPTREGETNLLFQWFDPTGLKYKNYTQDIFKIPVKELIEISELKRLFAQQLKEEKKEEVDAKHLRFREFSYRSPGKVYTDEEQLTRYVQSICIELLDGPEEKKDPEDLVIFVRRWNPSQFTLDAPESLLFHKDMDLPQLTEALCRMFSIESISVVKCASWNGNELLEVPDMRWEDGKNGVSEVLSKSPLYLRDSDTLFFKDNSEPLKELSAEERKKLEQAAQLARRSRSNYYGKEEALKINTQD